jgi:hypothetical protein
MYVLIREYVDVCFYFYFYFLKLKIKNNLKKSVDGNLCLAMDIGSVNHDVVMMADARHYSSRHCSDGERPVLQLVTLQ